MTLMTHHEQLNQGPEEAPLGNTYLVGEAFQEPCQAA